jgi:hypothetical protein
MNIPSNFNVQTKEFVQVFTKFCLYLSKFGTKAMEEYLDSIPVKMGKTDGKHLGAYIIGKILQEYEQTGTPFSRYDLFNSKERRQEISEARMLLCVLVHKYLNLEHREISSMFNKSRDFSKRALSEFGKLDNNIPTHRKLLAKYTKIDTLVNAYVNFKPKST